MLKTDNKHFDMAYMQEALNMYLLEQQELTKRKSVLRQRIHRLRKCIQDINQLDLPIEAQ